MDKVSSNNAHVYLEFASGIAYIFGGESRSILIDRCADDGDGAEDQKDVECFKSEYTDKWKCESDDPVGEQTQYKYSQETGERSEDGMWIPLNFKYFGKASKQVEMQQHYY